MMKAVWLVLVTAPAWGQEVTISDLNGVTVQFRRDYQETVIAYGKTHNPKVQFAGSVTIERNTVRSSVQVTSIHPDGRTQVSPLRSNTYTLNIPKKGNEGHDVVWVFSNGTLTRLLVHNTAGGAGAWKLAIGFKRGPAGLTCSVSHPMMRENGVGEIRRNGHRDKPITILELRQISSNCTVAKGG